MKISDINKIALIGGIGSGKSYIASIFRNYDISVFDTDVSARTLINQKSGYVHNSIKSEFGDAIFDFHDRLMTKPFAKILFSNKENLVKCNEIVAPAVMFEYYKWLNFINGGGQKDIKMVLTESAVLLDTDFYKLYDHIILVDTPYEIRKERVLKSRDMTAGEFDARVEMQMTTEEMIKLLNESSAKFSIFNNDGTKEVEPYVLSKIEKYGA